MRSVSGLSRRHRASARARFIHGAAILLHNAGSVHYTQDGRRWEGIQHRLHLPHFPNHGDCSSTLTWLLWVALNPYGVRDVVNGQGWRAGYTGTMLTHGKPVRDLAGLKVGDCAIYGWRWPGVHVVGYLGGGAWFSHGSERGPFKVGLHYRPDLLAIRRYI